MLMPSHRQLRLTHRNNRGIVLADDIDKLIKWAQSQGWTVITDSKGYRRFYNRNGDYVVRYPAMPSNPRRRLDDVKVKSGAAPGRVPAVHDLAGPTQSLRTSTA